MMRNTLLLHIGRPKTGTTALQVFLYENAPKLKEYGWNYPDIKGELPGVQGLWASKEKNGDFFFQKSNRLDLSSENWNQAWECVLKHLKNENVIISDERISWLDTDKFLTGAKEKYDNIKVIIYLRRQDRAIESGYNQAIKVGKSYSRTIQEYIKGESIGGIHLDGLHYLGLLDRISAIIGKENVIVKVYEKQQFGGTRHTLISDFLSVLNIEPNWDEWKECHRQNLRLYGNYFEIKRVFNSLQLVGGMNVQKAPYAVYLRRLSQVFAKEEEGIGYFTQEERKEFLKQFVSENEQIAKEYLHRKDGILFYDNKMDYPLHGECHCTSFEEDVIRLFSMVACEQDSEIQRLKRQNGILACKMMLRNRKGRKVLLFGAGRRCRRLLDNLRFPVAVIADNDEARAGEIFWGELEIFNAKMICNWSEYFVVITCAETGEMEKQLHGLGLEKERDYVLAKEYFDYN